MKRFAILVAVLAAGLGASRLPGDTEQSPAVPPDLLKDAQPAGLVLPSQLPLDDYERVLYGFLFTRKYQQLGWGVDKGVRDTGPFLNLNNYGSHPSVRIYYSPEIITWLVNGRKGAPADGAMIIKEMFTPPAVQYEELKKNPAFAGNPLLYQAELNRLMSGWTVLVKDSSVSKDGWFWAGPSAPAPGVPLPQAIDAALDTYAYNPNPPQGLPHFAPPASNTASGTCLRCHGSATEESTFSSTKNITGFPGEPTIFRTDNSWRTKEYLAGIRKSQGLGPDDPYVRGFIVLQPSERTYVLPASKGPDVNGGKHQPGDVAAAAPPAPPLPDPEPSAVFRATYSAIPNQPAGAIQHYPSNWTDHVPSGPRGPQQFITADNCLGCHGGLGGAPDGNVMFLQTGPQYGTGHNVSEFGEWRWSPLGLAGRDPIFHSQLESEMVYLERDVKAGLLPSAKLRETQQAVVNTCLSCHGAIGQRQLALDAAAGKKLPNGQPLDPNFKQGYFFITPALTEADKKQPDYDYHAYGALAREGVSCTICHHITAPDEAKVKASGLTGLAYALFHNNTGRFEQGPANELNGPFGPHEGLQVRPMQNALGITPKQNSFIKNSLLCGTCHTINLPNIGEENRPFPILDKSENIPAFKPFAHSLEQETFLEWQNSSFAGNGGQSCQDCHMRGSFQNRDKTLDIKQIVTQIASIQDSTYADADHRLPTDQLVVPLRKDYKRHQLSGLNAFLLEMFNQNERILGVSKTDYMTSATNGAQQSIDGITQTAEELTADVAVKIDARAGQRLDATVTVTNKAGHRFPSGVAFRRAFLEVLVIDRRGDVVWGSGRTNPAGVIVDGDGRPLPSEFFENGAFQPHYGGTAAPAVTAENQAQIYEELLQDAEGNFTTSFIHRVHEIKDNRLLPHGWREAKYFAGPGESAEIVEQFMLATDPKGVGGDPDYQDQGPGFPGQDSVKYQITLPAGVDPSGLTVQATLYSQATPPYYLKQRFDAAPGGEATQLLHYLTSHLDTRNTPIENWKLLIGRASAPPQP